MIKDADDAGITAGPNLTQNLEILSARADGQNLPTLGISIEIHAVQIDAQEVREHELERFVQAGEVVMAMMKVIDDPDVPDAVVLTKVHADGYHVLRFASPAAMVVDRHAATDLGGLGERG